VGVIRMITWLRLLLCPAGSFRVREAFWPCSPVLANLTGVCYRWGGVPRCDNLGIRLLCSLRPRQAYTGPLALRRFASTLGAKKL